MSYAMDAQERSKCVAVQQIRASFRRCFDKLGSVLASKTPGPSAEERCAFGAGKGHLGKEEGGLGGMGEVEVVWGFGCRLTQ